MNDLKPNENVKPRLTASDLLERGFEKPKKGVDKYEYDGLYGWYSDFYGSFTFEGSSLHIRNISDLDFILKLIDRPSYKKPESYHNTNKNLY